MSYEREVMYLRISAVVIILDMLLMALMNSSLDIGWGVLAAACVTNATLLLCWLVHAHMHPLTVYTIYIAYLVLVMCALWKKLKCGEDSVGSVQLSSSPEY